ncbi:hypothetical protein Tco_0532110 [Tanacetum coccineum]
MLQSPPVRRALSLRLKLRHLRKVRVRRKDVDISSGIGLHVPSSRRGISGSEESWRVSDVYGDLNNLSDAPGILITAKILSLAKRGNLTDRLEYTSGERSGQPRMSSSISISFDTARERRSLFRPSLEFKNCHSEEEYGQSSHNFD